MAGGLCVAVVLRLIYPDTPADFFLWSIGGMVVGTIIGLATMGMLKARMHPKVRTQLDRMEGDASA
jgi:hypothetical protein